MTIEIGYTRHNDSAIIAGTGSASTAGGSAGVQQQGTGTGVDALVATPTSEPITSTSPDLATPESATQYTARELSSRLPAQQIYSSACSYGDVTYWMDS